MLNNFIYAENKDLFIQHLEAGNILDEAIVFIADTGEIWNHGRYFAGDSGFDPAVINEMQIAISQMQYNKLDVLTAAETYATKSEIPTDTSQLTNGAGYLTSASLSEYATKEDLEIVDTKVTDLDTKLNNQFVLQSELDEALLGKQDIIEDLHTIRDNATLAVTAVQPDDLTVIEESIDSINVSLNNKVETSTLDNYLLKDSFNTTIVDYVPKTTTINDKPLSENIIITVTDLGAASKNELDALATTVAQKVDTSVAENTYATKDSLGEVGERITTLEGIISSGDDADDIINKWNEVVTFLDGVAEADDLEGLLAKKANQDSLNELITSTNTKFGEVNDNFKNYLSVSGGTIDSISAVPLTLNSTYNNAAIEIAFKHNGSQKGFVGYLNNGAYIGETSTQHRIGINESGLPVYKLGYEGAEAELMHADNIGSQSVRYAETAGSTVSSTTCTGNSATATALTSNDGSATQPIYFLDGKPKSCTYSLNKTVPENALFTDTNTTYNFTGGTNQFTVTPSHGSEYTVTVTPSITNNITGTGTNGRIAKFNGTQTITDGPAFGSDTSKYLRNDGSWVVPPNAVYSAGTNISINNSNVISATDTTYTAGSGIILNNGSFSHADTSSLNGSYGPTANVTGSNGATINIPQITVDEFGHVTGVTNRTYTSVNTDNDTTYSAGTGLSLSGTTFSTKLNSNSSLGTIGSTAKLYAIGVDSSGKLCVSVPWTDNNNTYSAGTGLSLNSSGVFSLTSDYQTNISNGNTAYGWGNHASAGYVKNSGVTQIVAGNGLAGGTISTTGTISLESVHTAASNYGPSSNASPAHGGTFSVPYITVDKYGRVSSASTKTITLPADSNSWRTIKCAGTDIGSNALNLAAGNNISLSHSSGTVTITATNTTYSNASQSAAGLMSAADKKKLDGIATSANAYSLPTASSSTLGGIKVGSNLSISNGVLSSAYPSTFVGSGGSAAAGLVPKPSTTAGTTKYLREDGSWSVPPDTNTWPTLSNLGIANVKNYDQSKAIKAISRSGTTFTYTCLDGTTGTFTQQDNNTTYSSLAAASGGTAVSLVTTGEKYTWNNKWTYAAASASANGAVTTGAQTFGGAKTFNSTVTSTGFYQSSDERLKNFGEDLKVDLNKLKKLSKKYFTFKSDPDTVHIGVSAQEVQEIYPEIVKADDEGMLKVEYDKLAVIGLKAVDELYDRLLKLEEAVYGNRN